MDCRIANPPDNERNKKTTPDIDELQCRDVQSHGDL
jgi:hypothetical protein